MEFDLSKFDLNAAAVHPYLTIVLKDKVYSVYEGAFGKWYQYFEIPKESNAGKTCKVYYEKYNVRNEYWYDYYRERKSLRRRSSDDLG